MSDITYPMGKVDVCNKFKLFSFQRYRMYANFSNAEEYVHMIPLMPYTFKAMVCTTIFIIRITLVKLHSLYSFPVKSKNNNFPFRKFKKIRQIPRSPF